MALWGARRMSGPAAVAVAAAQAAIDASATADTAIPRPSIEWVMLAFFSQRRAVLRPFSCNTSIGGDSTAKLRQSAGAVSKSCCQIGKHAYAGTESRMTAKGSAMKAWPAPGRLDRATFLRPIAHRGLHDKRKGRIENTAPAFLAAIDKSYGIECDLQAAKDGTPMVFHDERLDRLLGVGGRIAAHLPASLARLRYRRDDTHILRFAELLDLVGGRVPLLVEVKVDGRAPANNFLDKIARQARAYKGPIALM